METIVKTHNRLETAGIHRLHAWKLLRKHTQTGGNCWFPWAPRVETVVKTHELVETVASTGSMCGNRCENT